MLLQGIARESVLNIVSENFIALVKHNVSDLKVQFRPDLQLNIICKISYSCKFDPNHIRDFGLIKNLLAQISQLLFEDFLLFFEFCINKTNKLSIVYFFLFGFCCWLSRCGLAY